MFHVGQAQAHSQEGEQEEARGEAGEKRARAPPISNDTMSAINLHCRSLHQPDPTQAKSLEELKHFLLLCDEADSEIAH